MDAAMMEVQAAALFYEISASTAICPITDHRLRVIERHHALIGKGRLSVTSAGSFRLRSVR
ncbi:hypothetical protein [Rhodoblastus sp.]|uniref:hypothetical protein n=2 Tax=Rhodoblastus sp. TaxID=1962975 RepID=UPI003F9489FF